MVSLKVNFQKKDLWLLSAIVVFLVGVGYVIASYPYSQAIPNPGHGGDTTWVNIPGQGEMTLQDAITNGKLSGGGSSFGSWTSNDSSEHTIVSNKIYKATSDGFIVFAGSPHSSFWVYSDSNNPPQTERYRSYMYEDHPYVTGTLPIKKNDYFKLSWTYGPAPLYIYWLPTVNSGQLINQSI